MRFLFLLSFLITFNLSLAQINAADSTVQVVGYWNKNEKHTYDIKFEKFKIKDKDTITLQDIRYKADIEVTDSTENTYTVEWKYKQYSFGNATGRQIAENCISGIIKLFENQVIRFNTDENGSFKTLLNWEELRDKLNAALEALKSAKSYDVEATFLTSLPLNKEGIEDAVLKDMQLFYLFYGIKLQLGVALEQQINTGNSITGSIKSDTSLVLKSINYKEMLYNITYYQGFDAEAISKLTPIIAFMLADTIFKGSQYYETGNVKIQGLEDFYDVYMHDSGWPLKISYDHVALLPNKEQVIERRTVTLFE